MKIKTTKPNLIQHLRRFSVVCILSAWLSPGAAFASENSIKEAVRTFAKAGDQRDTGALEGVMAPEFRVVFVMGDAGEPMVLDRATYLNLVATKKIGGDDRKVQIDRIRAMGNLAWAKVKLKGSKARFEGVLTLVKRAGSWKVMSDTTHMKAVQTSG